MPPPPSRRQILNFALATGVGAAIGAAAARAKADPPQPADLESMLPKLRQIHDHLLSLAGKWVDARQLARADGFIYTVDAAQLMICFAQAGDVRGYAALREHAVKNVIRDSPKDAFTKGFVSWRWKAGEKLDASGTTEALRTAKGLWLGATAFNRPADADLAITVLQGYSRHSVVDQGIWIIRNYFGFGTRSFASNSFLVDYDPDFVREVADARKDAELQKLADECYGVITLAIAPSGLLYDMVQPEVKTLFPELNLAAFSPNDVIQLSNCCTTAITVARGLPAVARKVLAFALGRMDDLRTYYLGRDGAPLNDKAANISEYNTLVRLAAALASGQATATIADRALPIWSYFAEHAEPSQLYLVTETLQAVQAMIGMKKA